MAKKKKEKKKKKTKCASENAYIESKLPHRRLMLNFIYFRFSNQRGVKFFFWVIGGLQFGWVIELTVDLGQS